MSSAPPAPAPGAVDADAATADAVATAVVACPAVAGLSGGTFAEVATYLPGRRILGVRVRSDSIDVHVVGRYGTSVADLARQVRTAVAPYTDGRPVNVRVEDLRGSEPPAPVPDPRA